MSIDIRPESEIQLSISTDLGASNFEIDVIKILNWSSLSVAKVLLNAYIKIHF